jgi:hypothetical protein
MATPAQQQCSRHRCHRAAVGGDGLSIPLCGPHAAGLKRSQENAVRRRAEGDAYLRQRSREEARRVYADRWRRAHPNQHYSPARECPLCAKMVQSTADQLGDGPFDAYGPAPGAYEAHTAEHGAAWHEYQAQGRA